MRLLPHRCRRRALDPSHPLAGRTVYIPTMGEGNPEAAAAAFRWLGVEATTTPPSNARTVELGRKHLSGEECFPATVTLGDFLRVLETPGADPRRVAFFLPTTQGPCRFGQYVPYLQKVLREIGCAEVPVFATQSAGGYGEGGGLGLSFALALWRSILGSDALHRMLLRTRPYETVPGAADAAFRESLDDFCATLAESCARLPCQLRSLRASLLRGRERFRRVPARYDPDRLLVGVGGEIFCRLNRFSNVDVIRRLEERGAEVWLSQLGEWVFYTNAMERRVLAASGRRALLGRLRSYLRFRIMLRDEHFMTGPFHEDLEGCEEPRTIDEILDLAEPYLPPSGAQGEMVVSVGKAVYLARRGADAIADISPFSCMNGIVAEAIYPRISRENGGVPIRNFYFDGSQTDLDRDLGIFLELARSYRERKPWPRKHPARFPVPVEA